MKEMYLADFLHVVKDAGDLDRIIGKEHVELTAEELLLIDRVATGIEEKKVKIIITD